MADSPTASRQGGFCIRFRPVLEYTFVTFSTCILFDSHQSVMECALLYLRYMVVPNFMAIHSWGGRASRRRIISLVT